MYSRSEDKGLKADKQDGSEEIGRGFEAEVSKMKADLEKLAPDMKAIDRCVPTSFILCHYDED